MKKLLNKVDDVVVESLAGLAAAHPGLVKLHPSVKAVLRADAPQKKVAILSGGGSLLYGIDRMIEDSTHIRTMIVDDPLACAAHGAGKLLTKLDSMQDGMMNFLRNREMRN